MRKRRLSPCREDDTNRVYRPGLERSVVQATRNVIDDSLCRLQTVRSIAYWPANNDIIRPIPDRLVWSVRTFMVVIPQAGWA